MDDENQLLRVSQVAKILNVSPATIYTLGGTGEVSLLQIHRGHQGKAIGSDGMV